MNRPSRPIPKLRQGVATVELACVLPAFMALVFGSIEVCQRLHVKQSALIAAYEACRVATRPISDTAAVRNQCETLLDQQHVEGATIQIRNVTQDKNNLDGVATGDEIRIQITVPWAANTISQYVIGETGATFQVEAYMLRE